MLDQKTISVVKSTIPLLESAGPELTKHFYQRMFSHHPELKDIFNLAHQRKGDQPVALFNAVAAYAKNIDNLAALGPAVEKIAQKHTGFLITAEQYNIVGHHLLETLKELGGEAVTDEVIDAWGKAYGLLADIFIQRESQIYDDAAAHDGGWRGTRNFRITAKKQESSVITSFELTPVDDGPVMGFEPGQYLSLKVVHPDLENIEIRQYSLSDAPNGKSYRISVKRDSEGVVSQLLHDKFAVGDELAVIPPAGDFFLKTSAEKPLTLISGGVGLTPVMSMLNQRLNGETAETLWLHASEDGAAHAFGEEINHKLTQHNKLAAYTWYRAPGATDIQGSHYDFAGTMDLNAINGTLPTNGDFYICGPVGFMAHVKAQLTTMGVADAQIHYEVFGPHKGL